MMYLEALKVLGQNNRVFQAVSRLFANRAVRMFTFLAIGLLIAATATYAQVNTDAFFDKVSTLISGGFGKGIAVIGLLLGAILIFLNQIGVGIMVILGALLIALAPTVITFIFS